MPYIKREDREKFREITDEIDELFFNKKISAGELNYFISRIISSIFTMYTLDYQSINEVIGVLECAKLELYRRVAVPYEDKKIKQNGDVYE